MANSLPPPCEHKSTTRCMLTAVPCCCHCADKRPLATAYPMYVDGQGMKMQGKRWQRYCRKCKDYWEYCETHLELVPDLSPNSPAPSIRSTDMEHVLPDLAPPMLPNPLRQSPPVLQVPASNHSQHTTSRERRRQFRNMIRNMSPSRLTRRQYPLGTMEDVQREDYESPIAGMFGRAWTRFRDAEDVRRAAQEAGLSAEHEDEDLGDSQTVIHHGASSPDTHRQHLMPIRHRARFHNQFYGSRETNDLSRHRMPSILSRWEGIIGDSHTHDVEHSEPEDPRNAIDRQTRGPSRPKEDLMVNFSCKICLEQKITILCEPCMHAVMCTWCSQLYREECYRVDGRFDPKLWTCPICRAPITQCRKFYIE